MRRKEKLINGQVYHVFNRSIVKFIIFNNSSEYNRMLGLLELFRFKNFSHKYSRFIELEKHSQEKIIDKLRRESDCLVDIIAYCLMPTHVHFILRQVHDQGISNFMSRVLNGYSRFFNTRHQRNGPLWSGRFKNVPVGSDEQLLHLTRYLHLNPTSAGLIEMPEVWEHSSYNEFLGKNVKRICNFKDLIQVDPKQYKKFVDDQKEYQRQISKIKTLTIDDYSG